MDTQQLAKLAAGRCWAGYEPVPGKAPYSNDSCRPVGSKKKKKAEKKADESSALEEATALTGAGTVGGLSVNHLKNTLNLNRINPRIRALFKGINRPLRASQLGGYGKGAVIGGGLGLLTSLLTRMARQSSQAKQASDIQVLAAMSSNWPEQEKQAMGGALLFGVINALRQKQGDRSEGFGRGFATGVGTELGAGVGGMLGAATKSPTAALLGLLGGGYLGAQGTQKLMGPASYDPNNTLFARMTRGIKSGSADAPCSCNCGDTVSTCKCGPDCKCRKPGGSCYKGEKEASLMPLALAAGALGSYPYVRGAVSAMHGPQGYGVQEGVHGYLRGIGELGGGFAGAGLGSVLGAGLTHKMGGRNNSQAAAALLGALAGAGLGGYGGNRLIRKLTGKSPSEKEKEDKQEKQAGKRGLWDNIHAKRKRGEKPAKPGEKDYPDSKSWSKTVKAGSAIQVLAKLAASPAWQRSEGKNSEGGLNAKGRASYNASTGGNLKAPVTSKNPKGESAKRKSSFCARMGGMKAKLTGEKTKNDPDSRINKALRKWNC